MTTHAVEHEELQAYLDGELTPARRVDVDAHLRECRECARVLEELRQVSATLQQWQVEPAPASLRPPAVVQATARFSWTAWRIAAAAGGLAAIFLVVASVAIPNLLRSRMAVETARQAPVAVDNETPATSAAPQPPPTSAPASPPRAAMQAQKRAPNEPVTSSQRGEGQASGLAGPVGGVTAPATEAPTMETYATRELEARDAAEADAEEGKAEGEVFGRMERRRQAALQAADEAAPMSKEKAAQAPLANRATPGAVAEFRTDAAKVASAAAARLIAYNVTLTLEVKEFAGAKEKVEQAVSEAGGYVSQASTAETPNQPQRADLTLRVPAEQLGAVLEKLRGLGRVVNEQLSTEELTDQVVDLEARLANARVTEQRLVTVLKERTGKVRDILAVEREIARTREEIERMEAHRQNLLNRVALATVQVTLLEEYKAQLEPAPVGTATRLRNAFVEGYQRFAGMLLGFVFFLARYGLVLLFWIALVWLTGRALVRRVRPLIGSLAG